jgi:hypothetical protein
MPQALRDKPHRDVHILLFGQLTGFSLLDILAQKVQSEPCEDPLVVVLGV